MYEEYDINDIKGSEPTEPFARLARMLRTFCSENVTKAICYTLIAVCAFFKKVGLVLSLPFKFVQFWIEAYRENSRKPKE